MLLPAHRPLQMHPSFFQPGLCLLPGSFRHAKITLLLLSTRAVFAAAGRVRIEVYMRLFQLARLLVPCSTAAQRFFLFKRAQYPTKRMHVSVACTLVHRCFWVGHACLQVGPLAAGQLVGATAVTTRRLVSVFLFRIYLDPMGLVWLLYGWACGPTLVWSANAHRM